MSHTPEECEKRIMIIPKDAFDEERKQLSLEVITLQHPFSGEGCKFLLSESRDKIYDITAQKEKYSSWFVQDTVKEDGSIFICTKYDPLYLVLPYLKNASEGSKFVLIDQILKDDNYPDCSKLIKLCSKEDLLKIADTTGSGGYVAFKYNKDKTLSWLAFKINKIQESLKKSGLFIAASDEDDKENVNIHLEYAFGILSSYLPKDIATLLQSHQKIEKRTDKRRSQDPLNHPQPKKTKTERGAAEKSKKQPKMSKAQRELSKVDKKGMKSISSFFSPKAK